MLMADVRVGMKLRSTSCGAWASEIEVTEITPRGFRYRVPDYLEVVSPHLGGTPARDGHECFGVDGEAPYEPVVKA